MRHNVKRKGVDMRRSRIVKKKKKKKTEQKLVRARQQQDGK